jgi:hypothetical protein
MSPGVNRWHGKTRSADAIPAECLGSFLLRHNEILWVPKTPSKRLTWGYCAGGLEDRIGVR